MFSTDTLINALDQGLKTLSGVSVGTARECPANNIPANDVPANDANLNQEQRNHTGALMRVNHSGEVCAQGLYHGQAVTAKLDTVRDSMQQAAKEEIDHLLWCHMRMTELSTKASLLNPLWYVTSFALGAVAGALGDRISLGFVAEIEDQVHSHLQRHINQLSSDDARTKAILVQMQTDEYQHKQIALSAGGITFPKNLRRLMSISSKIMTEVSYRI